MANVTITGSDTYFTNIDSSFTATKWEACIDQAINKLNQHSLSLSNLSGDAGSKTGTYTSAEAGAIQELAALIYAFTKIAGATSKTRSVGAISSSQSSSTSGNTGNIDETARNMANSLKSRAIYRT